MHIGLVEEGDIKGAKFGQNIVKYKNKKMESNPSIHFLNDKNDYLFIYLCVRLNFFKSLFEPN